MNDTSASILTRVLLEIAKEITVLLKIGKKGERLQRLFLLQIYIQTMIKFQMGYTHWLHCLRNIS